MDAYVMHSGSDKMVKRGILAGLSVIVAIFLVSPAAAVFSAKSTAKKRIPAETKLFASAPATLSHSESSETLSAYEKPLFTGTLKKGRDAALFLSGSGFSCTESDFFCRIFGLPVLSISFPIKSISRRAP